MSAPVKLTARQKQILHFIEQRIDSCGAPPTRAEIAEAFGFKSPNAAAEHLRALARKGVLELRSGTARGIRLAALASAASQAPRTTLLALPLIGHVAAGAPILAHQCIERYYRLDRSLFAERPDYLLRVRGLSMMGAGILDGDLLAVRRTPEAQSGQIVVARLGDEITVKRLRRTREGICLLPENPSYLPIPIDGSQPFAIEGRAVGLLRCGGI